MGGACARQVEVRAGRDTGMAIAASGATARTGWLLGRDRAAGAESASGAAWSPHAMVQGVPLDVGQQHTWCAGARWHSGLALATSGCAVMATPMMSAATRCLI